jgi:Sulfotransferase domain
MTGAPRAIIASFRSSGRTWLRFMLAHYIVRSHQLAITVDTVTCYSVCPELDADRPGLADFLPLRDPGLPRLPLLMFSHSNVDWLDRIFALAGVLGGSHAGVFRDMPIVFLMRGFYDLLVSNFSELAVRQRPKFERLQAEGATIAPYLLTDDLDVFVRGRVDALIDYTNAWCEHLPHHHGPALVLTYEQLRRDPLKGLREVLDFAGIERNSDALVHAVESSTLEQMRRAERTTDAAGNHVALDQLAGFRARTGRVGGWRERLRTPTIEFIDARCRDRLTPATQRWLEERGLWFAGGWPS